MNASVAYETVKQTLLILAPEVLILLAAMAMITASAFVKLPRRSWCAISAATLVVALLALIANGNRQVDPYSAVALNDAGDARIERRPLGLGAERLPGSLLDRANVGFGVGLCFQASQALLDF